MCWTWGVDPGVYAERLAALGLSVTGVDIQVWYEGIPPSRQPRLTTHRHTPRSWLTSHRGAPRSGLLVAPIAAGTVVLTVLLASYAGGLASARVAWATPADTQHGTG